MEPTIEAPAFVQPARPEPQLVHTLFFLRHAPAGTAAEWPGPDTERPLTEEGRRKLKQQKRAFRRLVGKPDVIVSSHYARAWQTAEAVARQLDFSGAIEKADALGHGGEPMALDSLIVDRPRGSSILFVGHSPDLEMWLARLLRAADGRFIELRKGGVCRIDVMQRGDERIATLKWLMTPSALRELG